MRQLRMTLAFVTLLLLTFVGCSSTSTEQSAKSREADQAAERARQEMRDARLAAKRSLEARLIEMENRLSVLRAETKNASVKARRTLKQDLEILEADMKDMRGKLSRFDDAADDAWRDIKNSIEEQMAKLEHKMNELRREKKTS